jgi:hypothetical protein
MSTVCYWKWPIYSGFTHWKWWFSIVMLVYQRVNPKVEDREFCISLQRWRSTRAVHCRIGKYMNMAT